MTILGEKSLSTAVKLVLDGVFYGGILIFLGLPMILNWYLNWLHTDSHLIYVFMMVFLYCTGLASLLLLYWLRRVFKNLNKGNPFTLDNVKYLNQMAIASFVNAIAYIVKIFVINSLLTIVIAMAFIIAGLFCIILAEVFRQASLVKEENELTI